ncbi:TatD family hydrolase [Thalassotalea agariperforans]
MKFTDSHCHLDFPELSENLADVISQCAADNIHKIIIPSVSPDNWQQVLNLTKQHHHKNCRLFACLGIHPWYLNKLTSKDLNKLEIAVKSQPQDIIAIGETGIDGKIAEQENNLTKQLAFFEFHLQLAKSSNKPIIIHHRKSHQHIVPLLKKITVDKTGVIHAFSGSYQQAKDYLDLGYKLGIGGTITYPRAEKTLKTVKKLPLDAMVLETDAPAMPLYGNQGQANSPLRLLDVFNRLCQLRSESPAVIAEQLELNVKTVFSL